MINSIRLACSMMALILSGISTVASASSCEALPFLIDDSRSELRRTVNESILESAKSQASWTKSKLIDTAMAAQDCGCKMAYSEFNTAAMRVSRARDAYSRYQLVDSINSAISAFNAGVDALRICKNTQRQTDE